MNPARY